MVQSFATTVSEYLASLPNDRRETLSRLRQLILKNLPPGYQEGMLYGMISYFIPLEKYPETYNKQPLTVISLAAQKNYCAVYLMSYAYPSELKTWFENEVKKTGKKLDMGKSCIRFKNPDELPLEVIGSAVAKVTPNQFIAFYEASRQK